MIFIKKVLKANNIQRLDVTLLSSIEFALEQLDIDENNTIVDNIFTKTSNVYLKDEHNLDLDHIAMVSAVVVKNKIYQVTDREIVNIVSKIDIDNTNWTSEAAVLELIERYSK
jgi:hypothetical protein